MRKLGSAHSNTRILSQETQHLLRITIASKMYKIDIILTYIHCAVTELEHAL